MSTTLPKRMEERETSTNGTGTARAGRSASPSTRRKAVYVVVTALGLVIALTAIGAAVVESLRGPDRTLVHYTVKRGDLPITVTERGNLKSQQQTEIVCEVENFSYDRSGNNGTQILYIVPNGKSVEEGELLVELDSAPLRERLDSQILETEEERGEFTQAKVQYENQADRNATTLAEAELQVKLAELELEMYGDEEDGTYQLAMQELELKVQEAKNQIVEAQAAMAMQTTDRTGIEQLYKLGYRGKGDLDQAVYKYLQAEDSLVKATNTLANALSSQRKLKEYEQPMQILQLEGALKTAERSLAQVERDNEAMMEEAKSDLLRAQRQLQKEEEILKNYRAQLEKCKIHAPHAGMVVYANESSSRWRGSTIIGEGAVVRQRQKILTLPDLTKMQVETAVHESVLDRIDVGMRADIKIDAFPDRVYPGKVESVAVLPDQGGWMSADIKVYKTIVTIDEEVQQLKPGMTAVVEIQVDHLTNVLTVPVQAIVQIGDENWCYVNAGGAVERRPIALGRTNDKYVEITKGLAEGDRVILNPMDVADHSEATKDTASPAAAEGVALL